MTMKRTFFSFYAAFLLVLFCGWSNPSNATNYAMELPGVSGAASNINISGVKLSTLPYTMEAWIKIAERPAQYAGLIYHRTSASIGAGVQFAANWQMNNTPNSLRVNNNISGDYGLISDTITLNEWHHFAVVVTETGRTCYVDGSKSAQSIAIAPYDFSVDNLWIGRDSANATNDNRAFKGLIDEVRIWNVAKTATELANDKYRTLTGSETGLVGYWNFNDSAAVATDLSANARHGYITGGTYVRATPTELMNALSNLTLGELTQVMDNLTLPTTADGGVTIRWASSNPAIIDTLGHVTRPEQYDATVKLTATLNIVVGSETYTFTKKFTATVKALMDAAMQVAKWDFATDHITLNSGAINVLDASESGFTATLKNDATIRTIGSSEKFNVLDLGNGTGYLDLGTEIGKAIYSLSNYTIFGYFRVGNEYSDLNSAGNIFWTFSNSADIAAEKNGYMMGSLKSQTQNISKVNNTVGNQTLGANTNASQGAWHNMAYTQSDETGTLYIDGSVVATGTITNTPATALYQAGRTGTLFNWLGRSPYASDSYLRKTLLYDFEVWRDAMTSDDLNMEIGIGDVLDKLNAAYAEDTNYVDPSLTTEKEALTLDNLTALTSDVTLPSKGTVDNTISILWKSSHPTIISDAGVVSRPDYYPFAVTLTATLFKNGQTITKTFPATVLAKTGSEFAGSLLVKYDFETVTNDTIVTDAAEKHFTGIVKAPANVKTIGLTMPYKVLDLANGTGYFDMGAEMGKALIHLTDYTTSVYYRVDTVYKSLGTAGNFLYTFSNSTNSTADMNGNIFCGLNNQTVDITPKYWAASSGAQGVSVGSAALTGSWHNMTYVQKADTGYIYVDGIMVASDTITNKPTCLLQPGLLGTPCNWIGRSCYSGDVYLRNTLVYDFRLYSRALSEEEIQTSVLKVGETVNGLEAAYAETPVVKLREQNKASIEVCASNGIIRISGLNGTEKISLYDLAGRQVRVISPDEINVKAGLYLLKVDQTVKKVFVR
jgi:hypothetical protein